MQTWHKARSFKDAFRYASAGIAEVYTSEPNVRRQFLLFILALVLGLVIRLSYLELAIVVVVSALVISLEYMNTALEKIEDVVWPEYREAIRVSKDAAAGAVLIASFAAIVVAALIYIPALVALLVY